MNRLSCVITLAAVLVSRSMVHGQETMPPLSASQPKTNPPPRTLAQGMPWGTFNQVSASKDYYGEGPLGRFVNWLLAPARMLAGHKDAPTYADIARMSPANTSPPEAAAAKIKLNESGVQSRLASVRYLASVDRHFYPEAEDALVSALRCDRNESVRLEAAQALGNNRGTSKKTLEALQLVLSGTDADGNPAESSLNVRKAALTALHLSLASPDGVRLTRAFQDASRITGGGAALAFEAAPQQPNRQQTAEQIYRQQVEAAILQAQRTYAESVGLTRLPALRVPPAQIPAPPTAAAPAPSAPHQRISFAEELTLPQLPPMPASIPTPVPTPIPTPQSTDPAPLPSGMNKSGLTPIGQLPGQP